MLVAADCNDELAIDGLQADCTEKLLRVDGDDSMLVTADQALESAAVSRGILKAAGHKRKQRRHAQKKEYAVRKASGRHRGAHRAPF